MSGGMLVLKVYPQIEDDLFIRLFHKGAKSQWTADDVEWDIPLQFSTEQGRALAHMLTPVYLGEQSAMIGASAALPQMAMSGETSSQIYLASFLMDEARHFEVLTRFYQRLEEDPLSIRQMPEMLRYHHRLRQGDRVDWVWGILISDIFAKNFYQIFSRSQPDALFGKMSGRILIDESRHQAFAEHYLKRAIPTLDTERLVALMSMRDDLLRTMDGMYGRLKDEADLLNIDGRLFLDNLREEIEYKAQRIGLSGGRPPSNQDKGSSRRVVRGLGQGAKAIAQDVAEKFQSFTTGRCDTCFVSLLCRTRLITAAHC